jgi:hypothetical protein
VDDSSCWFLQQSGTKYDLIAHTSASVWTTMGTIAVVPANGDILSVTLNGNSVTASINGANPITVTSTSNQTATKHGLMTNNSNARFDNFQIDDLATGGVVQTGAASLQGVSTITASATLIPGAITGSASLQGIATLNAAATVTNNSVTGAATVQGIGTLSATGSLIQSASASMMGVSTLSAFAAGLTVQGAASLQGVGWLAASGFSGVSISRSVNLLASMVEAINLLGESVAPVNLEANWISSISLLGSNPEPIALEGGLMTKLKQDFTMFAGDTPPLTFTMSDSTSLSGATVKWVMRKGHVKGPQALLKTTLNGGLVASGTVATVNLLSADTLSLEGKFYHEAEVTDVLGKVSTVMTGTITIEPSGV